MDEVVTLHARARTALRVGVVHDLRVAIRRCRALAQGLREIDDDEGAREWKALSDAGRPLFQGLGDLRDAQVMREHGESLLADDPSKALVLDVIDARIRRVKEGARAAVAAFDGDLWRRTGTSLPSRAAALLEQRALFDHLALRRFSEARELHHAAMRSKSAVGLHDLRIAVKKLRYTVENFLPEVHAQVGKLLKKLQELLGDIHDLDVLHTFLGSEHVHLHSDDRSRVCQSIRLVRDGKVAAYRALCASTDERDGAWTLLRSPLLEGSEMAEAHRAVFLRKARCHGVTEADARSLERSALTLVAALAPRLRPLKDARAPALVRAAAICLLVDGGGKPARRFARRLPLALGFSERDRALLEAVAASAANAPGPEDKRILVLPARDQALVVALGAVLHLAAVLRHSAPFVVRDDDAVLTLLVTHGMEDAEGFARSRAPLEALLGKPMWWRAPTPT